MIKTGKAISSIVEDINQEFSTKVDKATTIATIPLSDSITARHLLAKVFVISPERKGETPPTGWAAAQPIKSVEEFKQFLKEQENDPFVLASTDSVFGQR